MTDDELWQAIEALARKQEPAIQQAVLSAFAALSQIVDTETLAAAVAMGPTAVLALFPDEAFAAAFQAMPKALHGAAVAAGTAEAKSLVARLTDALKTATALAEGGRPSSLSTPGVTSLGAATSWSPKIMQFQFDVLNPKVTEAVRQQAASLVVQVTQQVKDAIREEVRLGMLRGENPRETARAIRQHIGLTAKQQQAVANFRQELMTFHERDKAGAWNLGGKISRAPGGAQTFAIGPDGKPLDAITARRLRDFRYDSVLQSAMQSGKPLSQVQIDKMTEAYARKYLRHRSETIARTESLRSASIGAHQSWRQAIEQKLVSEHWLKRFWLIGRDERSCLTCRGVLNANKEGRAFEEPFMTPAGERIHLPPLHPNCVPGDSLVAPGGRITAVSKRWYEGEMIVIEVAGCQKLTITPNHPILTPHGWIAAGKINKGDDVFQCFGAPGKSSVIDNQNKNMPTRISEITESFLRSSEVATAKMPTTSIDFHGDGMDGEVCVIGANRFLLHDIVARFNQQIAHHYFFLADMVSRVFIGFGSDHHFFKWNNPVSGCVMCGSNLVGSFFGGHPTPFNSFLFTGVTHSNTIAMQKTTDSGTTPVSHARQTQDRLAGQIQVNKVLRVSRIPFCGHVYNLETDKGFYKANSLIVHNCRCVIINKVVA